MAYEAAHCTVIMDRKFMYIVQCMYMYFKAAPNMILTSIMFKCSAFCFVAEYFQLGGDSAMLADCHESEGDLLLVLSEVTSGGQWW